MLVLNTETHAEHGGLGPVIVAGRIELIRRQRAHVQPRPSVDLLQLWTPLLQLQRWEKTRRDGYGSMAPLSWCRLLRPLACWNVRSMLPHESPHESPHRCRSGSVLYLMWLPAREAGRLQAELVDDDGHQQVGVRHPQHRIDVLREAPGSVYVQLQRRRGQHVSRQADWCSNIANGRWQQSAGSLHVKQRTGTSAMS